MPQVIELAHPSTRVGGKGTKEFYWDENYGETHLQQASTSSHITRPLSASLSQHVISHGYYVIKTNPVVSNGAQENWIEWETPLNHPVCSVVANKTGTVIAASTTDGIVSLLRGVDGSILATRRIPQSNKFESPNHLKFVSSSKFISSLSNDVLCIIPEPYNKNNDKSNNDSFSSINEFEMIGTNVTEENNARKIIVVSGIDGEALSSSNKTEVAKTARNMSIDAVDLPFLCDQNTHISSVNGCFIDETTIRFIFSISDKYLSIYDYDISTKSFKTVRNELLLTEEGRLETAAGIQFDCMNSDKIFFLLAMKTSTEVKICWYDLSNLDLLCDYSICDCTSPDYPLVMSFQVVESLIKNSSLAVAVAYKSNSASADADLKIIQCLIDEDPDNCASESNSPMSSKMIKTSKVAITKPHMVYNIKAEPTIEQTSIVSIDIAETIGMSTKKPFHCRYKIQYESNKSEYKDFITEDSDYTGKFRYSLARKQFEEANSIVALLTSSESSNSYCSINPSEVALEKFKDMLNSGKILSRGSMDQVKECLRRLASGAVAGDNNGVEYLLKASFFLYNFHVNVAFGKDGLPPGPQLRDFRLALTAMSMAIGNAVRGVNSSHITILKENQMMIDERVNTLKCIEEILNTGKREVYLTPPLSNIESITDLFSFLISAGAFSVAEKVRSSSYGKSITSEIVTLSFLRIQSNLDPRSFTPVLQSSIIPSLSYTHPLVSSIKRWACELADQYDDFNEKQSNHFQIESSIHLLQTVYDAILKLSLDSHSSFANYSPFSGGSIVENSIPKSINSKAIISNDESNNSSVSCITIGSDASNRNSHLEDVLKITSSKHPKRVNTKPTDDLSLNSALAFESSSQLAEAGDQCVGLKLLQARLLMKARKLDLDVKVLTLKNYSKMGGAEYVVRELLRTSVERSHDNIHERMETIRQFCTESEVNFDKAILHFVKELLESARGTTDATLSLACELARMCFDQVVKSQICLDIIRTALSSHFIPHSVKLLSIDAAAWAIDEDSKSELEEATRLLAIDQIVRRYCGVQDFFQVSNTRHAVRLLHHVCRYIDEPSVLDDALSLCDAFTHLSRTDACVLLLQRIALKSSAFVENDNKCQISPEARSDQCSTFLRSLHDKDSKICETVALRGVMFCEKTISDSVIKLRRDYVNDDNHRLKAITMSACFSACSILRTLHELHHDHTFHSTENLVLNMLGTNSSKVLLQEFVRIRDLQSCFDIFISLSDLRSCPNNPDIIKRIFSDVITAIKGESLQDDGCVDLEKVLADARKGCSLLCGGDAVDVASHWCQSIYHINFQILSEFDDKKSLQLLIISGLLSETRSVAAYEAIVKVAMDMCFKAFKLRSTMPDGNADPLLLLPCMRYIVTAASILQEHAVMFCPSRLLPSMVFASSITDIATQILARSDNGIGDQIYQLRLQLDQTVKELREPHVNTSQRKVKVDDSIHLGASPILHPSFYVGDGLLLPPVDSLSCCLQYCKELFTNPNHHEGMHSSLTNIYSVVNSRGCYSLSLRLLSCASAVFLSRTSLSEYSLINYEENYSKLQDLMVLLSERYLGGAGVGITSSVIDSQLAVNLLLTLPLKIAFKLYKRSLPSAMSRRYFQRVITLANIGSRAGGAKSPRESLDIQLSWKNQNDFVSQCQTLSSNSIWWLILQVLEVPFDPSRFETSGKRGNNTEVGESNPYVLTLLPLLIANSFRKLVNPILVLELAQAYVENFSLDINQAPKKIVEYLLTWPGTKDLRMEDVCNIFHTKEIRFDLDACTNSVRELSAMLPSFIDRYSVVRKCLISLESYDDAGKDYEWYSLVLGICRSELLLLLNEQSSKCCVDKRYIIELESIDRRKDALGILLSFFSGKNESERPLFHKLFRPFSESLTLDNSSHWNILGQYGQGNKCSFDPLLPLQNYLFNDPSISTASALDPICHSLSLPNGFVRARCLMGRIIKSIGLSLKPPSFDDEIFPVIKRLSSPQDGAELAEWCSQHFHDDSEERLKCLEIALNLAILASNEAEHRFRSNPENKVYEDDERRALEAVKRLGEMKASLTDLISIRTIYLDGINSNSTLTLSTVVQSLVEKAKKTDNHTYLPPEEFVENLLIEGSLLSAEAALDSSLCMPLDEFHKVARLTHKACLSLSEQYSHINLQKIERKLVNRWLIHGDEVQNAKINENLKKSSYVGPIQEEHDNSYSFDEDDTMNLKLDIKSIAIGNEAWAEEVDYNDQHYKKGNKVTADEESSVLKSLSSSREISEFNSARSGLRIAFIMSYAKDFYSTQDFDRDGNDENMNPNFNQEPFLGLSKNVDKMDSSNLNMDHAKFLLKIVFAKSGNFSFRSGNSASGIVAPNQSLNQSTRVSTMLPYEGEIISNRSNSLTFAMRHRALRAASILCPESILRMVIEQERYLDKTSDNTLLSKYCFGSFLAKEIEEMGLPLPHSDLLPLSIMHFPSYARSLWRHHGLSECRGYKGRVLLLLLQLTLKNDESMDQSIDQSMIASILTETLKYDLPRTLLLQCESLVNFDHIESTLATNDNLGKKLLPEILKKLSFIILKELSQVENETTELTECTDTLMRFGKILNRFSSFPSCDIDVLFFVECFCKESSRYSNVHSTIGTTLLHVADKFCQNIQDDELKMKAFSIMNGIDGCPAELKDIPTVQPECNFTPSIKKVNLQESTSDCMSLLYNLEYNLQQK